MNKYTIVIRKESSIDPRNPRQKNFYAATSLFDDDNKEIGTPRHLSGFEEVARLLENHAGASHEVLQDRVGQYDRGDDVRIFLTPENDEFILQFFGLASLTKS